MIKFCWYTDDNENMKWIGIVFFFTFGLYTNKIIGGIMSAYVHTIVTFVPRYGLYSIISAILLYFYTNYLVSGSYNPSDEQDTRKSTHVNACLKINFPDYWKILERYEG